MSTTCEKEFTITVLEGEMPLNSAVHEPSRDRIYAVRDNWVFELSASTGAKVSQYRFAAAGVPSDTYIDYDSTTDRLWATYWRSTQNANGAATDGKYLVKINPSDITDVTLYTFTGAMSVGGFTGRWDGGPRQIITRAGIGWAIYSAGQAPPQERLVRINLLVPSVTHTGVISAAASTWGNFTYDGTNLAGCSNAPSVDGQRWSAATLASIGSITGSGVLFPYAVAFSGTSYYMATNSQFVVKGGGTVIDLGRASANPHNIRYNSNDGLIYIPLYRDDTVAVLNPADDSFVIKTGFTNPFDAVFTPTKKFAVQHSSIGLKEIT